MKRFFAEMNPTVRGFAIIAVIVAAIVAFRPAAITFGIVWTIAQILFLIAISYVIYRWWREHRGEINLWSGRAKWTFYVAWWLAVAELVIASSVGAVLLNVNLRGVTLMAWLVGLVIAVYAMWRIWTDERTYGY